MSDGPNEPKKTFLHQRMDVYVQSRKMARGAMSIANEIPRGYGKVTDQLKRAAVAVPLLIAEAANRRSRAQKRQRFEEALGEVGECAAAIELAMDFELVDEDLAKETLERAARVAAMLVRLEEKFRS